MTEIDKPDEKEVGRMIPSHESTALVRSKMRENLLDQLKGFLAKFPNNEKALAVTDKKRWEARFAEIIALLSPDARGEVCLALGLFAQYWQTMSVSEREAVALGIGERIIAWRTLENMQKEDPSLLAPPGDPSRTRH